MEIPLWLQIAVVLLVVWSLLIVVLLVAGRVMLARELALLLPHLIRLFNGLLRDPRVPLRAKIVLGIATLWLASPIDLIPEFIPILGPLDDAIVAAFALRFLASTTDGTIVRQHWHGDPVILERVLRLVTWRRASPRALPPR